MQTFKINLKSNYRVAGKMLFYIGIATLSILIIAFQNFADSMFMIKSIAIICIIINAPPIFLHFSYYLENKKWIVKELDHAIEIHKDDTVCLIVDQTNIISIDVYMSPTFIKYGISGHLPIEEYNYMKITTKNDTVIITNLLYPNIKQLAKKFSTIIPQFHETIFAAP